MTGANYKPGARRNEQTGPSISEHFAENFTPLPDRNVKADLLAAFSRRVWVLNYSLEEARQRCADRRQFLREACVCVVLALLRLAGVHCV